MVGAARGFVWKLRVFPSYLGFKVTGRMGQGGSSRRSPGTGRWDPALLGWDGMAKSDSWPGRRGQTRHSFLKPVSANTSGPGPPMGAGGRGRGLGPSVWGAGLGCQGMKDFKTPSSARARASGRSGFGFSQHASSQMPRGQRGEHLGPGPSGELRGWQLGCAPVGLTLEQLGLHCWAPPDPSWCGEGGGGMAFQTCRGANRPVPPSLGWRGSLSWGEGRERDFKTRGEAAKEGGG